jgi:ribosomal protein S18 acetylase RimI-like enzyme
VQGVAELQALWVSRAYRRRGIATALVERLLNLAAQTGAWAVYVSASPAEAAQAFYGRQGFRPATFVHRDLYDKEPEDIHMIKVLGPMDVPPAEWMCAPGTGGEHEH